MKLTELTNEELEMIQGGFSGWIIDTINTAIITWHVVNGTAEEYFLGDE